MDSNDRMNDFGVWNKSTPHKKIESNEMDLPQPAVLPYGETNVPYVFVGDDAFALKTFMMKPYVQHHLNISRRVYNYRHSRARRISENLFGILSNRFRVFHAVINLDPNKAKFITMSAIGLHNFHCPPGLSDQENEQLYLVHGGKISLVRCLFPSRQYHMVIIRLLMLNV